MTKKNRSIVSYFYWPLGFIVFGLVMYLTLNSPLFTRSFSVSQEDMTAGVSAIAEAVPASAIPENFSAPGSFEVVFGDGVIVMSAQVDGAVLGHELQARMVAIGRPINLGSGFWSTLWEQLTGHETDKRIVYHFYDFRIDPETFIIDGEPAIETAVPGGQRVVEHVAEETVAGRLVTGGLNRLGFNTSDTARDAWTAETMRAFQVPLINMFSQYVENHINNRTLYEFGDSTLENVVVTVFKGFEIENEQLSLVFTMAKVFMIVGLAVFTFFYSFGWFLSRGFMIARDRGVVSQHLSDETAEKIGAAADLLNR